MPLQNRVTPEGDIVAMSERGLFMGNRGILHDAEQRLQTARWRHPHWVTCVLAWKGWHREVMQPRNYTELFFMDEATALAAGHRPCALCRRKAYTDFQDALKAALHRDQHLDAASLDRMLHTARIEAGTRLQRRFEAGISDLPDGTMILRRAMVAGQAMVASRATGDGQDEASSEHGGDIWLVLGRHLRRWRPNGYDRVVRRPKGVAVEVLTPRPTVLALQQGYKPALHPSALS